MNALPPGCTGERGANIHRCSSHGRASDPLRAPREGLFSGSQMWDLGLLGSHS